MIHADDLSEVADFLETEPEDLEEPASRWLERWRRARLDAARVIRISVRRRVGGRRHKRPKARQNAELWPVWRAEWREFVIAKRVARGESREDVIADLDTVIVRSPVRGDETRADVMIEL